MLAKFLGEPFLCLGCHEIFFIFYTYFLLVRLAEVNNYKGSWIIEKIHTKRGKIPTKTTTFILNYLIFVKEHYHKHRSN